VNVVIYVRVSSADQVNGYSLEAQITEIRAWCHSQSYTITQVFEEPGKSAKSDERPVFQKLIGDIERGLLKPGAVVFHRVDRFAHLIKSEILPPERRNTRRFLCLRTTNLFCVPVREIYHSQKRRLKAWLKRWNWPAKMSQIWLKKRPIKIWLFNSLSFWRKIQVDTLWQFVLLWSRTANSLGKSVFSPNFSNLIQLAAMSRICRPLLCTGIVNLAVPLWIRLIAV